MNGGTDEPSTAVVNVLVDIDFVTRGYDSGLGMVRMTCRGGSAHPPASDFADRIIPLGAYYDPLGLGSAQTDESWPRRIRKRTCDDMVSMSCENRCAWLRVNRPQVLNASTSTSPTSSEPSPNGDAVVHEKEASPSHRDERQIMLDTDRSFVHYPSGEASSPTPPPI